MTRGAYLLRGACRLRKKAQSPVRFDPEPDLDNANVGMSEKILQKSCRQKSRQRPKKTLPAFCFTWNVV